MLFTNSPKEDKSNNIGTGIISNPSFTAVARILA